MSSGPHGYGSAGESGQHNAPEPGAGPVPGSSWAWDQYWQDGRLASCGGADGSGYQPAIAEGWREFFAALPAGSRILDACSGNGALARLAESVGAARSVHFDIDAFDSARIAPGRNAPPSAVRYRSRVAAESTPYPSGVFDAIVGQYAIEYTDLSRTLPELRRVSRQNCRPRFVVHAREGIVVGAARRQLEDVARLRAVGDIFGTASALARSRAGEPGTEPDAAAQNFRACLDRLQVAAQGAVEPQMFRDVAGVIVHALRHQHQVGTAPVLNKIAEAAGTIEAHAGRLTAMTGAARDERGARELADEVAHLWQRPMRCVAVNRPDGPLLGWGIEPGRSEPAARPADPRFPDENAR